MEYYDESVIKLPKVSFLRKCARTGHPLKLPHQQNSPAGPFFPAIARRPCVLCVYIFSGVTFLLSAGPGYMACWGGVERLCTYETFLEGDQMSAFLSIIFLGARVTVFL
jgi:hypothetical protein